MRIVIGEDSALVREGLARLLIDAGHDVVARVADAEAVVRAVEEHSPDLLIADIRMPPGMVDDGARAARELRRTRPELPIVLLSQHIETTHSLELVATGSFGYLLKDRVLDVDDFLAALERVRAGGSALDPTVVASLLAPTRSADPLAALTEREGEVLALLAEGRSNAAIARQLWTTDRTVETHVRHIFAKLGLVDSEGDNRRVLAVLTYLRLRTSR
ncbi:MAG TPA: response regulator transcription factor [Streptosporangiaceae bacterium]|nr:response regulator transcription factor [Streptosporangiaceae bacterium]